MDLLNSLAGDFISQTSDALQGALGVDTNSDASPSAPNPTPQAPYTVPAGTALPSGTGANAPVLRKTFLQEYGLPLGIGAAVLVLAVILIKR